MGINEPVASFDISTSTESRFVNARRSNVKTDLIEITEDKLENILLKHLKKMETRKGWLAPLGLLISVVLANVTAAFTAKFGISASTWEAVFILGAIGSGIWFITSLIAMKLNWKESTTDFLISQIKDSEEK
ncbi:hypothetical protein Sputw3181_2877 [Shewanella sp. W3-18-1]|uniref:hypothetical protein n=1 Tax=Shewanella sp. (strain W3-18-1) TaxID=351745 RepID=UPI0000ECFB37|nr:hypothetical protein [Shewanella sp. W3-18-1]ABM25694.1 hypothetical protein Sputw3181_2877 [Shewanella sp. W3-18-1]